LPENVELIEGHLLDEDSLRRAVEGCWGVIHIGGAVKAKNIQDFYYTNRDGTAKLVTAARDVGVKRFLLCSSQAAVGPNTNKSRRGRSNEPNSSATRRKPYDPPTPISDYGKSKLAGEDALKAKAGDMWWCIVRPPAVYGPFDTSFLSLAKGIRHGIKLRLGSGSTFSMIHVEDLAHAMILALEAGQSSGSIYFATDGEDHTDDKLAKIVESALGKRVMQVHIPIWFAYMIAGLLEFGGKVTGKAVFLTRQKITEVTQFYYTCDDTSLREATGYAPKYDLETGMKQTIEWYKEKGWI